jgi:hypothetical protein
LLLPNHSTGIPCEARLELLDDPAALHVDHASSFITHRPDASLSLHLTQPLHCLAFLALLRHQQTPLGFPWSRFACRVGQLTLRFSRLLLCCLLRASPIARRKRTVGVQFGPFFTWAGNNPAQRLTHFCWPVRQDANETAVSACVLPLLPRARVSSTAAAYSPQPR